MSTTTLTSSQRDDDTPAARQARRVWIYTASVKGAYQRVHRWSGFLLQAILLLVPWVNVGGHPAFQIDLVGRRFYALGAVFTPRETIFLVLMLLFSAFSLFFFTALFGRLWCGYACPQTVFLEEWIRPIERLIEGERGTRMMRDRKGWTFDNAWRKGAKWLAFLAVAGLVAMSFVSWFAGARPLWGGAAGWEAYTVVGVLTAGMFFDFAWFREQFCNFLCPYARFQGALCDDHSLVVAYDTARGEPRGKPTKAVAARVATPVGEPAQGEGAHTQIATGAAGACIDCKKCVTVCPQGIDIRDGFQLECITCGRCIDACQGVMDKMGQPNLITYTQLERGAFIRPRTVVYAALLTGIAAVFVTLLANRHEVEANVVRAPGTLYTVDGDGWVRNTYLLRVTNRHFEDEQYAVDVEGLPAGGQIQATPLALTGGETRTVPLIVRVPPGAVSGGTTIPLSVSVASHDDRITLDATFAGGS